jgi:hypothetical protein
VTLDPRIEKIRLDGMDLLWCIYYNKSIPSRRIFLKFQLLFLNLTKIKRKDNFGDLDPRIEKIRLDGVDLL